MKACMLIIVATAIILCGAISATVCSAAKSEKIISIVPKEDPLTAEEITYAIDLLGLRLRRFELETKEKIRLRLTLREYLNGKEVKTYSSPALSLKPGQNVLTIRDQQRKEDDLTIWCGEKNKDSNSSGSVHIADIDTRGYPLSRKVYGATLTGGQKTLLCVWAGSNPEKGGNAGFEGAGQSLKDVVSKNDLVLALFVEEEKQSRK